MMLHCIAIDDEPLALELIEKYCGQIDFLHLDRTFSRTSEATKYLNKFPVDLLFLDIQMPDISGIDFYKSVSQNTMVIFTTAFSEYAVDGFNLSAIDYLLKPFELDRFQVAVNKAREYAGYLRASGKKETAHIFVRSDYHLVKITLTEIIFIETLDDFLRIHIDGRPAVITLMTLKAIQEKLPASEFIRVHRSYVVPLKRIQSVRNKVILLDTLVEIPIGTTYEDEFMRMFGK